MSPLKRLQLASALALSLAANTVCAAFINITENGIDPVTVSTNLLSLNGDLPIINTTTETAFVLGVLFPAISTSPILPGLRSAGLLEPGTTRLIDLVVVDVGPVLGPVTCSNVQFGFGCQPLQLNFYSEMPGGPPLSSLIPSGTFGGTLVANGSLQDLSALLGTLPEGLLVRLQADIATVPEPATLLLLVAGLVTFAFIQKGAKGARRQRSRIPA